jgi:molybdopterin-containing oxidoreductase family iron-sulfur binding subunit
MRYGMVIDLKKCVGCYSCVIKCKQEHFLPPGMTWGKLLISETGTYPNIVKNVYPVLCNHCADPACVKACPTNATQQREDGIVFVDQDKCVGCRYCLVACPFQVRSFYSKKKEYYPGQGLTDFEKMGEDLYPLQKGIVLKCNFCQDRIDDGVKKGLRPGVDAGATPACVNICPAKARTFGDLDDPESEVTRLIREKRAAQFHPEYGTDPSVYYVIA